MSWHCLVAVSIMCIVCNTIISLKCKLFNENYVLYPPKKSTLSYTWRPYKNQEQVLSKRFCLSWRLRQLTTCPSVLFNQWWVLLLLQNGAGGGSEKTEFHRTVPLTGHSMYWRSKTFESFSDPLSGGCRESWFIIFRLSSALKYFYPGYCILKACIPRQQIARISWVQLSVSLGPILQHNP